MSTDSAADRRTGLIDLFDRAKVNGVAYLVIVCELGSASKADLTEITGEDESTFGKYLLRMESRGLLVRTRVGKADRWFPTPAATQQLHAVEKMLSAAEIALLPKISVATPPSSSSSDPIDQSVPDQIQTDQSEEEEEADGVEFKAWLCKHYGLTGDKAKLLIADKRIWSDDLVAWMLQVGKMKRDGFRFKKSAEAYALHCLLKGDEPNADAQHMTGVVIDQHWREFQKHLSYRAEAASEKQ